MRESMQLKMKDKLRINDHEPGVQCGHEVQSTPDATAALTNSIYLPYSC